MSEIKTLEVEVTHPDILDVDVDFGQTLTKVVAPEKYLGPFEFYPSDEDQIIPVKEKVPAEDICVKGITGEKTITQNGTYNTLADKTVTVDVNPDLRPLSVNENGSYQPDGFDGYSQVSVDVPVPSGSTTITENGTYDVEQYANAVVDVPSAEWTTAGIADGSEPNGDIDLGDVETVIPHAFFGRPISSVHGNAVTTLSNSAFSSCTNLVSVVLPYSNCGTQAFSGCQALKNLHLPRATFIPTSGITNTGLEFLYLPSLQTVGPACMQSNALLETVILPECTSLTSSSTLNNCKKLTTIVLGGSAVVPIGTNSLKNTPFANGGTGGHVYIRKSLYDHLSDGTAQDYLKNANWNTLNGYGTITWHPIEGSEYETYMPGGAKYEEEMALT